MEKTNPEKEATYVGVDISKERLDYTVDGCRCEAVANTAQGHAALVRQFEKLPAPVRVICEATGGYERAMAAALIEAKIEVCIVPPHRVRASAEAEGLLAKTDRLDARLLHRYGCKYRPRMHVPADPACVALRELLDYRRDVSDQLVAVRNRLELAGPLLRARLEAQLGFLKNELTQVDRQIAEHIDHDDNLRGKAQRMRQLKGVGPILAATLLAHVPELTEMTANQLACLVGVAPHSKDSGKSHRPRHVRGGRRVARNVLYMAAIAASRHNRFFAAFYARLRARGKAGPVAIVAVMRKMLHVIHRLLTDPNFALAS